MKRLRYILFSVMAMAATVGMAQGKSIAQSVYWFDLDASNAQSFDQSVPIDITSLVPGTHVFSMRVQDNEGLWSSAVTRYFIIPSALDVEQSATAIVAREYWIDGDIAARAAIGESPTTVSLLDLAQGVHFYTMRVQDDLGVWSSAVTQYFLIPLPEDQTTEETSIERCMYWFDDDISNYAVAEIDGTTGMAPIDVSALTAGDHVIHWRVGDSRGAWSQEVFSSFLRYKVPASGIGTFSAAENMMVPEGLTVHHTTVYNDRYSTVHVADIEGQVLPAATGVLLKGEGGEMFTFVPTDEEAPTVADNTLVAVVEATHVPQTDGEYTNFMLQGGRFIPIAEAEESTMMPAHRAYLQLPTDALASDAGTNGITLKWGDGEATGIVSVDGEAPPVTDEFYDLQGRRVTHPRHGVYITRGKKVVVK